MRKTVVRHLFKGEHYLNRTEDLHSDYRASVARARHGSELLEEALNWQFRKGWPDITCHWSPGKTAYIEVKRAKLGEVSPEQEAMHEKLRSLGFPVAVVTSQDEAYHFLEQCGAPRSAEML